MSAANRTAEKALNRTQRGEKETALITGASEGIGLELSKLFAREGYDLVLVARNEEKLNQISGDLSSKYGVSVKVIAKDLSNSTAPGEIYDELKSGAIEVSVLVNNAGYTLYGPFAETDISEESKMLQVLLWAPTQLTKLFLRDMLKANRGKILNLGSTGSFAPCPFESLYAAAKAYILFFSEAIAEELAGSKVTVTVLCPGATRTQFARRSKTENTWLFRLGTMGADRVAEIGYRALMENRRYVVAGIHNKLTVFAMRFMPRSLVTKVVKYLVT